MHTIQIRFAGSVFNSLPVIKEESGILIYPSLLPISSTFSILLPNTATLRLHATAASRICAKRYVLDANVETIILPGVFAICSLIACATLPSEIDHPGTEEFVESLINKVTPICPI